MGSVRSGFSDFYSTAHREVSNCSYAHAHSWSKGTKTLGTRVGSFKMASARGEYIESLIVKLSSKSESGTKKALMELTKLTKGKDNVHWFRVKGGLKHLLSLIQRPNRTIADMALSALANCAREQESKREVSVHRIKVGTSLFIFIDYITFEFIFQLYR